MKRMRALIVVAAAVVAVLPLCGCGYSSPGPVDSYLRYRQHGTQEYLDERADARERQERRERGD